GGTTFRYVAPGTVTRWTSTAEQITVGDVTWGLLCPVCQQSKVNDIMTKDHDNQTPGALPVTCSGCKGTLICMGCVENCIGNCCPNCGREKFVDMLGKNELDLRAAVRTVAVKQRLCDQCGMQTSSMFAETH